MNLLIGTLIAALLAVAMFLSWRSRQTLRRIEAEGLVVDLRLPTNPRLLVDKQHRCVVALYAGRYDVLRFEQIVGIERRINPSAKNSRDTAYLDLQLQNHERERYRVKVKGRVLAEKVQQQLRSLLAEP